jgi:flavin-dependent dehydrogenase
MHNFNRDIPACEAYDLVVCGGGPSGIPAALSARRAGLKVLLVEQTGQLGGVGTSAGVSHLLGGRTRDNKHWCVGGIFKEIVEDLAERGGAINPVDIEGEKFSPHGWTGEVSNLTYGVPFDPIQMEGILDEKMLEAGVDVLFFTSMVDVFVESNAPVFPAIVYQQVQSATIGQLELLSLVLERRRPHLGGGQLILTSRHWHPP